MSKENSKDWQKTKVFYWFDDEYRVTDYIDAGVTMIEKLVKRGKRGEKWQIIFHTHTALLQEIAQYATGNKDKL
jgi:hypothetical protein